MTLEASLGVALLLFVFVGILAIYQHLWQKLREQQMSTSTAYRAAATPRAAGERTVWSDGQIEAEAVWGDDFLLVRARSADGRITTERLLPREAQ